jgi:hypothetical protein
MPLDTFCNSLAKQLARGQPGQRVGDFRRQLAIRFPARLFGWFAVR